MEYDFNNIESVSDIIIHLPYAEMMALSRALRTIAVNHDAFFKDASDSLFAEILTDWAKMVEKAMVEAN